MAEATQEQIDAARNNVAGQPVHDQPNTDLDAHGQPIHAGAEPIEGEPAAPAAAAPVADDPNQEAERRRKIDSKRYKDDKRSAIYERRDAMTLQERQDLETVDAESLAILDAQAGHEPAAPAPTPAATPTAAGPAPAPAPAAPVASVGKSYRLNIYGQEQEYSESDLITLAQKGLAADTHQRDNAEYARSLEVWRGQLQEHADGLARTASQQQAPPGPAGSPAPTTTGAAGAIDEATTREALDALARGETAEATRLMQKAISDAVAGAVKTAHPAAPAAPGPRQGEVPRFEPPVPADPWSAQRQTANATFNTEFAHLTDPQFEAVQVRLKAKMGQPESKIRPLLDLAREAAQDLGYRSAPAPAPAQPSATEQELAGRRVLKARLPLTPPIGGGRAPTGEAPAPAYPSNSQYVEGLRKRSGSNSTRT